MERWMQAVRGFWKPSASPDDALLRRLDELERELKRLADAAKPDEPSPVIVIEQLTVANLVVEKLEHSTNFGALGIKELTGKLNIGLNRIGDSDEEAPGTARHRPGRSERKSGEGNAEAGATDEPAQRDNAEQGRNGRRGDADALGADRPWPGPSLRLRPRP